MLSSSILKSKVGSDIDLVKRREGLKLHWYRCTEGFKTGGYGHVYRKGDPATFDMTIAEAWLEVDIGAARKAAMKQFDQLPLQTQTLFDVLVSVNFQLGVSWFKEHKKTWAHMVAGRYPEALHEAQNSKWYRQTPVRVKDLQMALRDAYLLAQAYKDENHV